jgi:hypothetical protein
MTDNVIPVLFTPRQSIDSRRMLETIAQEEPETVFVICWPKDGGNPTYHSNTGDIPVIFFRLQEFIHGVYSGKYAEISN